MKLEEGGKDGTDNKKEEELKLPDEESLPEPESTQGGEEKQKKKADDLWASFLSDVGPRPKAVAPGSQQVSDSKIF